MADYPYLAKTILIEKLLYPEADFACLFETEQLSGNVQLIEIWSEGKILFASLHARPFVFISLSLFFFSLGKMGSCF